MGAKKPSVSPRATGNPPSPCPRSPNRRSVSSPRSSSSSATRRRLRILFYLALSENRELHVTHLCQRLGQSQPAVSHHLALLRVSGLIESRREGKHNFYSVRTDHFGELLLSLFSAAGEVPRNKKYKFHDFILCLQRSLSGRA